MKSDRLQRTLLVGLGRVGAQLAGEVQQRLARTLGPVGICESIGVQADAAEIAGLITLHLDEAINFQAWQVELTEMVGAALRRISHLHHLISLAGLGLGLNRPDEIHLIVVADLDEPWVGTALPGLVKTLRETVGQTLACQSGLTGLLVRKSPAFTGLPEPDPDKPFEVEKDELETVAALPGAGDVAAAGLFDRGCFVAGTTNEAGLVIGEPADLVQRAAHFLTLLITSPLSGAVGELSQNSTGWIMDSEATLATFGLATITWPGEEVGQILSCRWAAETLRRLVEPGAETLANPGENWVTRARGSAQLLVIAAGLTPPALLEQLEGLIPFQPDHLLEKIPDPPWPWLLAGVSASLERDIRQWETEWPVMRQTLIARLNMQAAAWPDLARQWLEQRWTQPSAGLLIQMKAYLAALSELLTAFEEGVEERLQERENDLVAVDGQVSQALEALAVHLAGLPGSLPAAMWQWGLSPRRWWQGWQRCRQAQAAARQLAQRWRQRQVVLQAVWLHELALPFYQNLRVEWRRIVETWEQYDQAVQQAGQLIRLTRWPEQLVAALGQSSGPWTEDMVERLYQEALQNDMSSLTAVLKGGPNLPGLARWVETGIDAEEMVRQLQNYAAAWLGPLLTMPVDKALARQFPTEAALADWLAAFMAQASPFWRYDEATLDELARGRVSLAGWLLAPGAESSPLAGLGQRLPQSPVLLNSRSPEELTAVMVRWGVSAGQLWETDSASAQRPVGDSASHSVREKQHPVKPDEGVEPLGEFLG